MIATKSKYRKGHLTLVPSSKWLFTLGSVVIQRKPVAWGGFETAFRSSDAFSYVVDIGTL